MSSFVVPTAVRRAWCTACAAVHIPDDVAARWLERLAAAHSDPPRAYHSLRHLDELATNYFAFVQPHATNEAGILFTLAFHDAVYDPTASDNEERSAELFSAFAQEVGASANDSASPSSVWPPGTQQLVHNTILATKRHMDTPVEGTPMDTLLFLDLDLGILAADASRYAEYSAAIRVEYAHVPDAAFRIGRSSVLERFLRAEPLFKTDLFRGLGREEMARRNLTWEIQQLRDDGENTVSAAASKSE